MQVNKKVKFKTIVVLSWVIVIYAIYPTSVYSAEIDKTRTISDFEPPFTFSIRTLTPDGEPQPGVKIRCTHPRSERGETLVEMVVASDANGVAKFNVTQANLSLDRWFWFFMADENFAGPSGVGISPIDNEYTYTFKVLPSEKFQILVLDENDKPIPNAKLWLVSDHPSFPAFERDVFETMVSTTADVNGLAEVKFADVETNIVASADSFAAEFVRGEPLPKDKPFTVKLSKGCTISGQVVDAENKPIKDVELSAKKKNFVMDYLDEFILKANTDAQGKFVLDKATEGEYEIQSLLRAPYEAFYAKTVSVKVDGTSPSAGVKIVVEQGAVLKGKYLTKHKMRLSNRTIFVSTFSPIRNSWQVQTAEDGSFVISGIPQNTEGTINFIGVAGYYTNLKMNETYPFFSIDSGNIRFRNIPPGAYEGVELEFLLSGCSTGTVYDSSGNPAPNCEIIVNPGGRISKTDDEGKYTADIPPNVDVTLEIVDPSSRQVIYYVEPFRIEEGQLIEKDITIGAVSSKLVGKSLLDFDGISIKADTEQTKSKKIIICFWDYEQRPSRNCIMQLSKRSEELKLQDVEIIAVHASKIEKEKLNDWIKENNIGFPVGAIEGNEEEMKLNWGVKSLPWLILTDKNHIVTAEEFSISELDEKIQDIQ